MTDIFLESLRARSSGAEASALAEELFESDSEQSLVESDSSENGKDGLDLAMVVYRYTKRVLDRCNERTKGVWRMQWR